MNGTAPLAPQASPDFYNHELLNKITSCIGKEAAQYSINWVLNSLYHKKPLAQLIDGEAARAYKQIVFLERKLPEAETYVSHASISQSDVFTAAINQLYYYHYNQSMKDLDAYDKLSHNPHLPVSQILSLPLLWHRNYLIRPLLAKETEEVWLRSRYNGHAPVSPIYFDSNESLQQLKSTLQMPQDNGEHESYAVYETTTYKLIGLVHYSFGERTSPSSANKPAKTYRCCQVNSLGVDAGYQKRGLGTTLMSIALIRAKQRDCKTVELTSTTSTINFLTNLSFKPVTIRRNAWNALSKEEKIRRVNNETIFGINLKQKAINQKFFDEVIPRLLGKVINTVQSVLNAPSSNTTQIAKNKKFKTTSSRKSKICHPKQTPPIFTQPLTLSHLAAIDTAVSRELALAKKLSLVNIKNLPPETNILRKMEFDPEHLLSSQLSPAIPNEPETFETIRPGNPVPFNFFIS